MNGWVWSHIMITYLVGDERPAQLQMQLSYNWHKVSVHSLE